MDAEQFYRVLSNVQGFPSLPAVIVRIGKIIDDPQGRVRDLSEVISQDPAISAKLLKVVNSAFFGLRQKVNSIQRAITMLGFRAVKQLAMTTAVISSFSEEESHSHEGFWVHCAAVATGARMYGKSIRLPQDDCEQLFSVGLLHDIGKLVIERYFPEPFKRMQAILAEKGCSVLEAEGEVLGLTHSTVGRIVLEKWGYDSAFYNVVAYHHALDVAPRFVSPTELRNAAVVALADTVAKRGKIGFSGDTAEARVPEQVYAILGVKEESVTELTRGLEGERENLQEFVSV
jgi:putative nucleotidyltransferase with HDIG domain